MRLRVPLVGATGRHEAVGDSCLLQRVGQPAPALAGCHPKAVPATRQGIEKFNDAAEQRYRSIGIDVVGAIAGCQTRIVVNRQRRGDVLQRIVQAEPDHVACICIGGNRQSEVCTGILERVDDDTGGIG